MARTRDPAGFAVLRQACEAGQVSPLTRDLSLRRIAAILAAKGGLVSDITAGDCLELAAAVTVDRGQDRAATECTSTSCCGRPGSSRAEAPASVRMFATRGQLTPAELIGRYGIECRPGPRPARGLPRRTAARGGLPDPAGLGPRPGQAVLARPGTPSSRASARCAFRRRQRPAGSSGSPAKRRRARPGRRSARRSAGTAAADALFTVRAFYLDIAQWAADDPARWAQWAAPCPVRAEEIPHAKELSRRKARMDQRTRERLPGPARCWSGPPPPNANAAAARLAACTAARPGETFTAGGQELRRAVLSPKASRPDLGRGPRHGKRRDLTLEEHRGVLGLGGHRGPPPYRDQDRGADRAVPPQPHPVPAARHRRAHPAAADRPVQDRRRTAPTY